MPTYTVRMVIRWAPRSNQTKQWIYEERITAWNTVSMEVAIDEAEKEAREYAKDHAGALDLFQAYWLSDELNLIPQGTEVFSLLRESDLEPEAYLNTFFDTGTEYLGEYSPDPPVRMENDRMETEEPRAPDCG